MDHHPPGQMEHAETVVQAGMGGAGIHEVGRSKLFYPVKLLKGLVGSDLQQPPGEGDIPPYRILHRLGVISEEVIEYIRNRVHDRSYYNLIVTSPANHPLDLRFDESDVI